MGILQTLFGGSSAKSQSNSESYNTNKDLVTNSLTPTMGLASDGSGALRDLLLGGNAGGFNTFKDNAGFNFAAKEGTTGVLGNMAAKGLLRSGASGRALVNFGEGLNQQYLNQYIQNLLGMSGLGIQAANSIGNVGQYTKSTSTSNSSESKGGLGQFLGALLLSDRRLKKDVVKIGELEDGLPVYSYTYNWDDEPQVGVMADEVAVYRPYALGPVVEGYQSVNYGKL